MSGDGAFGGVSLFELFKLEAESHCAALSEALLALEKSPAERSKVESLMRAAHSIKGAARIIGLDTLVTLAHAMEECFLAAKESPAALTSARVDQLLKGVDILAQVRTLSEPELPSWLERHSDNIAQLVAQLKARPPATAAPSAPPPPPAPTPAPQASAPAPGETPAPTTHGSVRVSAHVLSRMLSLAGESSVETSRFELVRARTARLQARERALEAAVASLRETLASDHRRAAPLAALTSAVDAVHTALLEQSSGIEDSLNRVEELSGALYSEVLRTRMRPFAEGVSAFPRMVRDIARELGKAVDFRIEGERVEVDREILQKLEAPLTHMLRNSLDHAIEPAAERLAAGKPERGAITLVARHHSGMLVVEVRDDGRGIDPEAIRQKVIQRGLFDAGAAQQLTREELMEFPFLPGFTTKVAATELSGRGVGLDVVRRMVQDASGTVTLESEPGRGARFTLRLPVTRSVIRAAIVRIDEQLFAFPLARLDRIAVVPRSELSIDAARYQIEADGRPVPLVHASDLFGGTPDADADDELSVLIFGTHARQTCGMIVSGFSGEEDLVVRPLDPRLGVVPHIAAAAIRADGRPVFVIDVDDLSRSVQRVLQEGRPLASQRSPSAAAPHARRRILVVDDSITVREVERQLLLRSGYAVDVAVDGKEGLSALKAGRYDLLITDIDMPRMTGLELIRAVRSEPRFARLPVIVVSYKDRDEDRRLGMEAGADAYLTKSSFHDESLIRTVESLIGAPT